MKIYTHLSRGEYHPVNCEDFLYHQLIGENLLIAAVMDGCSSGKESFFASAMLGKSIHKTCRMLPNMEEILPDFGLNSMDKQSIGSFILKQVFEDVKKIKRTLFLSIEEILSTLILMVFDASDDSAWINISGDGLIVCNGQIIEIDQNNMPDYLSYHLEQSFDAWLKDHTQIYEFANVRDISISTDGITKLGPVKRDLKKMDVVKSFLIQKIENEPKDVLDRFRLDLVKVGFIPCDDMGIIRLIP